MQGLPAAPFGLAAPAPLPWRVKTATHSDDLHQHMRLLTAWEQSYDQLSPGCFHGAISEAWIGDIQIFEESLSQAVFQHGAGRPGTLSMGVFAALSDAARWQGVAAGFEHVSCLTRRHTLEMRTPRHSTLLGLSIPLAQCPALQDGEFDHDPVDALERLATPLIHHPVLAARLRQQLGTALFTLMQQPPQLALDAARQQLGCELLGLVDTFIHAALTAETIVSPAKARRVVRLARDYMLAHPDTPLTVLDLCAQTHTSRRTLHDCFEQVVGMSPAAYLKVVRLNGVRQTLTSTDGRLTIGDAAARWGFWHLSQFSLDYKKLFGELPSRTLRRVH